MKPIFASKPLRKHSPSRQQGFLWLSPLLWCSGGCAHSPTFNILGSYFPGWLASLALGVLIAALVHVLLQRRGWESRIAALPLFYLSLTLAVACVSWLLAFE